MPINPRYFTTPAGALLGLALTRKLLPKEDLTLTNQAVGATAGGALGYMGGGYLDEAINKPSPDNRSEYIKYLRRKFIERGKDNYDEPSTEDLMEFAKALPEHARKPALDPKIAKKVQRDYLMQYFAPLASEWSRQEGWGEDSVNHWRALRDRSSKNILDQSGIIPSIKRYLFD